MLSVCGVNCKKDCSAYKKECKGCIALEGKVSWTKFINKDVCPIYNCVTKNRFESCYECSKLPCKIWLEETKNPSMTDYEYFSDLNKRIHNLTKKYAKKNISFKSYEKMAKYYATIVDEKPFNAYYERPNTLSLISKIEGQKILDAGCATGWYSDYFEKNGASSVIGIDFSPKMIEFAKKRNNNVKFYLHDMNKPLYFLQDQTFDLVVASLSLHYLKDWSLILSEFNRVLKNNGEFIMSTHHPIVDYLIFHKENYFEIDLCSDKWKMGDEIIDVEFYRRPFNEIINPIINSGFMIEKIHEPSFDNHFRLVAPSSYEKGKGKPQFLFIKAKKSR